MLNQPSFIYCCDRTLFHIAVLRDRSGNVSRPLLPIPQACLENLASLSRRNAKGIINQGQRSTHSQHGNRASAVPNRQRPNDLPRPTTRRSKAVWRHKPHSLADKRTPKPSRVL